MIGFLAAWSLRALVLSGALAAALALTRTRNAYWRKMLWTAALAGILAMPLLMSLPSGALVTAAPSLAPQVLTPRFALGRAAAVSLTGLYITVAAVLALYYGIGLVRLAGLRAGAEAVSASWTDGLDVRSSTVLTQPAAFGRTILLPANYAEWSELERAAVLAHERAHVCARDCYRLWLAQLHQCLCWFNPLAWWLTAHLGALAEATSDAAAIDRVGDATRYAQVLLEFASHTMEHGRLKHVPPVAAALFRVRLSTRIERILGTSAPQRPPARITAGLGIAPLVLTVLVCSLAHVEPVAALQAREADAQHALFVPRSRRNARLLSASRYPPRAAQQSMEGMAYVRVTVDAQGRATNVRLLRVTPAGVGFGAAALRFARALHYGNRAHRIERATLPVKFALSRPAAAAPRAR